MCLAPSIPDPIPPAQFQPMQQPVDLASRAGAGGRKTRLRGLYSSIFTSPGGVASAPNVTGTTGGMTGG